MLFLSGRPLLDYVVEELRPLDLVWHERRELAGLVFSGDIGDVLNNLLDDVSLERVRDGTPYSVLFLGDKKPTRLTTGDAGVLPRVRAPQAFRAPIGKLLEAAPEPADPAPVRFDFHAVTRAEAPALWRLLAVFRGWGGELAGVDVVRLFLWAAYLPITAIRDSSSLPSVRRQVNKASRAIADMTMQTNPVLSLLGEAAAHDLRAAVRARAFADGEAVVEKFASGLARAATPIGEARARRFSSVAWMRVRNTFSGFPEVLDQVQLELEEKYSARGVYRALT